MPYVIAVLTVVLALLLWCFVAGRNIAVFQGRIDQFFAGLAPRIRARRHSLKKLTELLKKHGYSDEALHSATEELGSMESYRDAVRALNQCRSGIDAFLAGNPDYAKGSDVQRLLKLDDKYFEEIESGIGLYDDTASLYNSLINSFPGVVVAARKGLKEYECLSR